MLNTNTKCAKRLIKVFSETKLSMIKIAHGCMDEESSTSSSFVTGNDNNDLYIQLYKAYEAATKNFIKIILSDETFHSRFISLINFLKTNFILFKDINELSVDVDFIERNTPFKAIDIVRYLVFQEFKIEEFEIEINSSDRTSIKPKFYSNKYILKSQLKVIIDNHREFTERRNSIIHRDGKLDEIYTTNFINRNSKKFDRLLSEGYYSNNNSKLTFNTSKKYLYYFIASTLGNLYILIDKAITIDSMVDLEKMLEDFTRLYLFLREDEMKNNQYNKSVLPIEILIMAIISQYQKDNRTELKNKFLLSNLALIYKKSNDENKYKLFIESYGVFIRKSSIGQMTLNWLAGNNTEAFTFFQTALDNNLLTEKDILKNIIFSEMDHEDEFLEIYNQFFKTVYPHQFHWFSTKRYLA